MRSGGSRRGRRCRDAQDDDQTGRSDTWQVRAPRRLWVGVPAPQAESRAQWLAVLEYKPTIRPIECGQVPGCVSGEK